MAPHAMDSLGCVGTCAVLEEDASEGSPNVKKLVDCPVACCLNDSMSEMDADGRPFRSDPSAVIVGFGEEVLGCSMLEDWSSPSERLAELGREGLDVIGCPCNSLCGNVRAELVAYLTIGFFQHLLHKMKRDILDEAALGANTHNTTVGESSLPRECEDSGFAVVRNLLDGGGCEEHVRIEVDGRPWVVGVVGRLIEEQGAGNVGPVAGVLELGCKQRCEQEIGLVQKGAGCVEKEVVLAEAHLDQGRDGALPVGKCNGLLSECG